MIAPARHHLSVTSHTPRAMRPLVLALVAIWPLQSLQAQPVAGVRPPVPALNAVPVPALKWQQSREKYEDGARSGLTERPNARGGVDQIIEQRLAREIYQWQRFDIGAASKVEFMLPSGGAALNRVDKGAAPSAIFGALTATVPNPNTAAGQPARIVGGDVYLLNANGILFGSGAQVNVGALVASTLNVDNEDFLNGLTRSINGAQRSFWRDPLGLPATQEGWGFVEVQPGAEIRTPNGGRVFLFAEEVKQAGRIETPGGQTVLAAGSEVYLQAPTAEKLYAAEHNAAVPALRGLLVEVGGEAGRVDQLGEILSARGNTTLVGMAVNQMGRISASTSVSENGSVFLMARGKASASSGGASVLKRASEGGSLVLGSNSRIEIAPEASTATSTDSAGFTPSRIEMSARSISLQGAEPSAVSGGSGSGPGASIVAPGASVRLRAETVPVYEVPDTPGSHALSLPKPDIPRFDATASLSLGRGVSIDLSGTRDTEVSAGRHYVTTELLGANDLKDAPLQKDGLLYRAKVTLDIRKDSKILGSLQSYRDALERSVQERLSGGGSLMLESAGLVQADAGSRLDLSGGRIRYTGAITQPSQLRGVDGLLYDLNDAPADLAYVGLSNAVYRHFGRWGAARSFVLGPSLALAGYEEGQAAGSLRVAGSQLRLDGEMLARTLVGERQREGLDKLAAPGRLQLGQASALATGVQHTLLLGSSAAAPAISGTGSWLDLARLDASGFGRYALASDGDIVVEQALRLAPRSQLSLFSRGAQGIRLAADVQSAGGTLSAQTVARPEQAGSQAGDIVVADGVRLELAGRLVNQERDGVQPQASADGGSLRLNSGAGLALGRDTLIDVSGGATVSGTGRVVAGAAGAIELRSSMVGDQAQRFDIEGARLLGLGLNRGGSLSLRAAEVEIGGSGSSQAEAGRLQLGTEFFSRGGFERLEIDGQRSLNLIAGSVLSPRLLNHGVSDQQLRLDPNNGQARASGALLAELGAAPREQEDALRRPVHLSLLASGQAAVGGSGRLLVEEGARISLDPLASLTLRAAADLRMDGQLQAAGGQLSLSQSGETAQQSQRLSLGRNALIDVSGRLLPLPSSDGLLRGRVLDGGQVSLSAQSLDWAQGALIRADGASATLDATTARGPALPEGRQLLSSHAGRLSVDLFSNASQDSLLAGRFEARAGSPERAQGALAISVGRRSETVALAHRLLLQSGAAQAQPLAGVRTVQLGTELFSAGLADLSLSSQDRLVLSGDLDLQLARRLVLDSPQLLLEGNGQARLSAASVALGSSSDARPGSSAPGRGTGRLTVQASGPSLDVFGHQQLGGMAALELVSAGDLRLHAQTSADPAKANRGSLKAEAHITLSAAQIYGSSASRFELDALGQDLLITRPEGSTATPATPLSAGAALSFKARDIVQDGLLRAPLGQLSLQASERLLLTPRSQSSVSGEGLTVFYGSTVGGEGWQYGGQALKALPAKQIDLQAPRLELQAQGSAKASLDLGGGGSLQALEFVAGPGGSRDVFAESFDGRNGAFAIVPGQTLAPLDNHMTQAGITALPGRELVLERALVLGEQVLAPGRYAVLPSRYALLPGAVLVRPEAASDTPVAAGTEQRRDNGAVMAGARLASTGTGIVEGRLAGYVFTPSATARKSSEIRSLDLDAYLKAQAQREGLPRPASVADAGHLNLSAQQLALAAQLRLTAADKGQAGSLAIAAERMRVGASAAARPADLPADTLWLAADDLVASGAGSLTLGALRAVDAKGQNLADVRARQLDVEAGTRLQGFADLKLLARETVSLGQGVQLQAAAPAPRPVTDEATATLQIKGDGASLQLSASGGETLLRSESGASPQGRLNLGQSVQLAGASLGLEAAGRLDLGADAALQVQALSLGASRILIGEGAAPTQPGELRLGANQLTQFLAAERLALRSYGDIVFEAGARLGGAGLGQLMLDAQRLSVREGGEASASAARLSLSNGGASAEQPVQGGSARLSLNALQGPLQIGPGSVQLQGLTAAELSSGSEIRLSGTGSLQTAGDLSLSAPRLVADAQARQQLQAGGLMQLQTQALVAGAPPAEAAGEAAQLSLSARELRQGTRIELPSGQLQLQAQGALRFERGSQTLLQGSSHELAQQRVNTPGGRLLASSAAGDMVLAPEARLDVSGGGSGAERAAGGELRLTAAQGRLDLQGQLRGQEARLLLDSRQALDLGALASQLGQEGGQFGELISVRNRQGDQRLPAGAELRARRLELSADQGAVQLQGSLRAEAERGALVQVAAGGDLRLMAGAQLLAANRGEAADGGEIRLMSSAGRISLEEGGRLATPGGAGGRDGEVLLRAARTGVTESGSQRGGTGVAVERLRASFEAVRRIEVEAVRRYEDITLISETATALPTPAPTVALTPRPTVKPTTAPTAAPTAGPTAAPTGAPTVAPTEAPTAAPTAAPTPAPTSPPTEPSPGNGSGTTIGVKPPPPPVGPKPAQLAGAQSLMLGSELPAGQVPPALLSAVRIAAAAEPATASAGNGNNTTIGNKPPAPPVGPPTAAPTPPPTAVPTPPAPTPPAPGPGPSPTPAPTAAPKPPAPAPVPKPPAPTPAPVPTPPPKILKPSQVEADNLAFVGTRAAQTQRIAAELAGGNAELAARLTVAPGVEIRSPGRLSLESEWNLVPASGSRVGEAMRLSLRAGGDLALLNSLSDGFAAARSATDKRAIAANGVAMAGRAASFRLVAGADLAAADPLAVNEAANVGGNLIIGRPGSSATATPPIVFIRSTTGSIAMAAAGDINLGVALNAQGRNGQVRIYTTGEALPTPSTQELNRLGLRLSDQLIPNGPGSSLGPFFDHAGAISLQAGRDVLSLPGYRYPSAGGQPTSVQYVADWWWRQLSLPSSQNPDQGLMFWSRYDQFAQGIASFGGGDIAVRAGRDLVDLELSTPASGYRLAAVGMPGNKDYLPEAGSWMPGGSLSASAGRDVLGGLYNAGGAQASLSAGAGIGGGSGRALAYAGPQLFHLDTRWSVQAGSDLQLGSLSNPALLSGLRQGTEAAAGDVRTAAATGLADRAQARLLSVSGDLSLSGQRPSGVTAVMTGAGENVLPDSLSLAAPAGGIRLDKPLVQLPVGEARLSLLARDELHLRRGFSVGATRAEDKGRAQPQPVAQARLQQLLGQWRSSPEGLDAGDRSPLILVSAEDSLRLEGSSFSARPLQLQAGRDLVLATLNVQHQVPGELSLLQAGRDLLLNGSSSSGLRVAGPGEVLVLAGRDADLRGGTGLLSEGNVNNATLLQPGGAALTLISAYQPADLAQAGAYALQGAGLQHHSALLAVQLKALSETGKTLDAAEAQTQAKDFAALKPQEQRARVQALVGESLLAVESERYLQQALALAEAQSRAATEAVAAGRVTGSGRDVARPPLAGSEFLAGEPRLQAVEPAARDAAQAAVRQELREALQGQALGAALLAKASSLGPQGYEQLLLAVSPHAAGLRDFVNARLGGAPRDAASAWREFAGLPAAQRLIFLQQTLMRELQAAGRAAAAGERAAYLRGYQAMQGLYPQAEARDGRILLANSQVKTAQGGAITLLAPGGSINVGDLAGQKGKSAADVGIVSVAGGAVQAAVRDSVEVNQSRIFTLAQGDVLLWAGLGNLDAGRGAKTVTGAPPPVYTLDREGRVVVDTSGSFSGSGIAVLDKGSALDLYAPLGEINAGDAGIKSAGNLFLGATVVRGADNIAATGAVQGASLAAPAPPPPSITPPTPAATEGGKREAASGDEDESRKRRPRRNLLLEFLGFGSSGD